jgi:hypothetical protein
MYELKNRLRVLAPAIFQIFSAIWRSPPVAFLFHGYQRWRMHRAIRLGGGMCAFNISAMMGLGATLTNMLILLNHCDKLGLRPYVRFTNPHYLPSGAKDWFASYFTLRGQTGPGPARWVHVPDADYRLPGLDRTPTLSRANAVFHQYVKIDDALSREADAFAVAKGLGSSSIGVHFRGTDKYLEAPPINWETMFAIIRQVAAAFPDARIFLATDVPEVIQQACESELGHRFVVYECREIFPGGASAHVTPGDRHRKAYEALVTMLILSKCGVCIRTASHLSAWSKILNPDQKVVMLNRPYDRFMHFPDQQVWEARTEVEDMIGVLTSSSQARAV